MSQDRDEKIDTSRQPLLLGFKCRIPLISAVLLQYFIGCAVGFHDAPPLVDPLIPTQSPHVSTNSESCVGQCAFIFVERLNKQLGTHLPSSDPHDDSDTESERVAGGLLNLNYSDFLTVFSNSSFFATFCSFYSDFRRCHSACSPSHMQKLLQHSAVIIDQFCVHNYQAILEKFSCLSQVDRGASQRCIQRCTPQNSESATLMQHFRRLALGGDSAEAERYLADSCAYVVCTLNCDVPAITIHCDKETAGLVVNITKDSFASLQRLALASHESASWPAVCRKIADYNVQPNERVMPKIPAGRKITAGPPAKEPPKDWGRLDNGSENFNGDPTLGEGTDNKVEGASAADSAVTPVTKEESSLRGKPTTNSPLHKLGRLNKITLLPANRTTIVVDAREEYEAEGVVEENNSTGGSSAKSGIKNGSSDGRVAILWIPTLFLDMILLMLSVAYFR